MVTKIIALSVVVLLTGCATTQRSAMSPTDLSGIKKNIYMIKDDIKAKKFDLADKNLDITLKLVDEKQSELLVATKHANTLADRLNYVEPKYAEAVGILWKWRMIAAASWAIIIGSFLWKFRRWFGVAA